MLEAVQYLEKNVENRELFQQLLLQLQKDFLMATQLEVFVQVDTAAEMVNELYRQLLRLVETDVSKFSSLFYRIDISEVVVEELQLRGLDLEAYLQALTIIILKREWQKICFRNKL
ncbi:hypothetical protein [Flavobacterium sp. NKUCC04_CG]|uniref:hypothetical protein n=1 Tax=Flavobacterium sp. NKUCC04_CG TaxID=2842121 RepID=UPI001C5B0B05|nr:hypothetical protein [Flavobacterium sp. NKUCC04_CG]MBW3518298.1 hypothetical protein [Flavobacterium sp. NKUCC04_CG]